MARSNRMATQNSNPAEKFFQWKSDHQKFAYYDKSEEKNVFVDLPLKFLAIAAYKTVKGFNPKKNCGIGCNEVKSIGKNSNETMKVYFFDDGKTTIAEGKWNDIKADVDNAGGKFTESVYAMLEDGSLVNFQINGASLSTWYDFQKNNSNKFFDNWIEVKGFKDGEQGKGRVKYTYPVFEWGTTLTRSEQKLAEEADAKIEAYEAYYFDGKVSENVGRENSAVDKHFEAKEEAEDDLAF